MSEQPLRILLVEDDPVQARLVQEILKVSMQERYELTTAERLSVALGLLATDGLDVVLLDLGLPDSQGFATFESVREHAPHSAIIVLSGLDDQVIALKAMQSGAQDYLVKADVDRRSLVRSIRYAVERKRVRDELWESEERTRLIIETARDAFVEMDANGLIEDWNPRAEALFGVPRAVARGRSLLDAILPPEERAKYRGLFLGAGDTAQGLVRNEPVETVALHSDGHSFPIELSVWPVRTRRSRQFNALIRDITERKNAQMALSAERDLLSALIESVPDQIYVKDKSGRFIRTNSAVVHFFHMKGPEELLGKTDFDLFPHGLAQQFFNEELEILSSGKMLVNRDAVVTQSNGTPHWELTTKAPFRDHRGNIIGTVGINRDVTSLKLAEQEMKQANAELEKSRSQLQKTLGDLQHAHGELRSAQMQLIEAEKLRTVGRLAAGVAHEVKNPLAVLLRGVNFLARALGSRDPVFTVVLKDMLDAIRRADVVIRGMLDFAAPSDIQPKAQDVNEVVEQALNMVKHDIDEHHVLIEKVLAPGLPKCPLDQQKMQEVFINVFENSIHAMSNGGTLRVRTYAKTVSGFGGNVGDSTIDRFQMGDNLVVIHVEDTGHGIPEDKLAKIFDPFFTTKPTGQGTGLGLSVCKTIMDLHGGSLVIRNRPGNGIGAEAIITLKADYSV